MISNSSIYCHMQPFKFNATIYLLLIQIKTIYSINICINIAYIVLE